jgi:thiol:disulfide interchange protein
VKTLPKSGEWMNTLKVSLGFIELAAALKFFSNAEYALAAALDAARGVLRDLDR